MDEVFLNILSARLLELLPVDKNELSASIHEVKEKMRKWLDELSAQTSEFNIRMYFVQLLSEKVKMNHIFSNELFLSVLWDDLGIGKIDGVVNFRDKDWKIIKRNIGKHFGTEFVFQNKDNEVFTWEFFD